MTKKKLYVDINKKIVDFNKKKCNILKRIFPNSCQVKVITSNISSENRNKLLSNGTL